jgi:NAD(P)-dependent dehydrogenase (short-subunit alcohol dehydrogenase family)
MNLELQGKKALVTGSTAGIAKHLALEGASVVINGRSEENVKTAVQKLQTIIDHRPKDKPIIEGIHADLSTDEGISLLRSRFSEFDIVVNNLGFYEAKKFEDIKRSDWNAMFTTNVISGAEVTRVYLPGMLKRNEGRIIFVSSESALNVPSDMIAYATSKAAQVTMARGYAEATKGTAVTVNSVLPGPTYSEGTKKFLDSVMGPHSENRGEKERQFIAMHRPSSLIQRFERVEEISALVTYLASPLSSGTNGAAMRVEGGLLRSAF